MCKEIVTLCKNCNEVNSSFQNVYIYCRVMCQRMETIFKAEGICIICDFILLNKP